MRSVLFLFIALSFISTQAVSSPAEDKRLTILRTERVGVEAELAAELEGYSREKDKQSAFKRITTLRRNLEALDIEIKHTGQIPEVRGLEVATASSTESKRPRGVVSEEGGRRVVQKSEVQASKGSYEAWDVFKNF